MKKFKLFNNLTKSSVYIIETDLSSVIKPANYNVLVGESNKGPMSQPINLVIKYMSGSIIGDTKNISVYIQSFLIAHILDFQLLILEVLNPKDSYIS